MRKLFYLFIASIIAVSCGDDGPSLPPIVGVWELDEVSLSVTDVEFKHVEFSREKKLFGEDAYIFEFKADMTYERTLEDVETTSGRVDFEEDGEWELDDDELDLDVDGTETGGLSYRYTVTENSGNALILEYDTQTRAFSQTKINEWRADGTVDGNGFFTVEGPELDSIETNFLQTVDVTLLLEFDK